MVNLSEMAPELVKELAFTEEELQELEEVRKRKIIFDEDCLETTPERVMKFRRVKPPRSTIKNLNHTGAIYLF